jgi:FtsP/CotA-like multicopper oxidase with cupredoxin domain
MSNIAKFDTIRLYLRQQFPKHHIADFQEGTSRAQVFRIDGPHGHPLHYAVIEFDFLLAQTAEDLQQVLVSSGLGDKLKEAGVSPVMLSKTGFSTEGNIANA